MKLTVTKAAPTQALCTVQQVREQLVTIAADDAAATAALTGLVAASSSRIARELGYEPGRQMYRLEFISRTGVTTLALPVPVAPSVRSVALVRGGSVQWNETAHGVLVLDVRPWAEVAIVFDAGWPTSPAVVACPPDLAHAAVQLTASLWHRRGRSHDISSEDLGGVAGVSYDTQRLPMDVLDAINLYRTYRV